MLNFSAKSWPQTDFNKQIMILMAMLETLSSVECQSGCVLFIFIFSFMTMKQITTSTSDKFTHIYSEFAIFRKQMYSTI